MIPREYLNVTKGERNKNLIRLQNIYFWRAHNEMIELSNPKTFQDQAVYLYPKDQNNGDKMDINTQEATGDPVICPVRPEAALVQNILILPGSNLDTPIF